MEKVKVLHMEIDVHMGGIESFLFNLYSQIDRERVQFDFVTRSNSPAMESELRELGAKIYRVSSYKNPLAYMRDLNAVIEYGYDIIHIHKNSAAVILPFIVAHKHKNIRVFVHSHNTSPSIGGATQLLHILNRNILWKYSDEHFACSQIAGEWLYGKNKTFTVLKNGINTNAYKYDLQRRMAKRKELGIAENIFAIGNVGRFTEQKNQKRLVQIFEEYIRKNSNSVLLLVGDGEQKNVVENYCKERNLTKHVMFLGIRKDIPDLMMAMDAFVMPSIYEGLPIVAIEAQSAGLPLYLSNTISDETDITSNVKWFSLEEDNKAIAGIICDEQSTTQERIERNSKVVTAGFDMGETAKILQDAYVETTENNPRKEGQSCTL